MPCVWGEGGIMGMQLKWASAERATLPYTWDNILSLPWLRLETPLNVILTDRIYYTMHVALVDESVCTRAAMCRFDCLLPVVHALHANSVKAVGKDVG
jgi:hypothetical protein